MSLDNDCFTYFLPSPAHTDDDLNQKLQIYKQRKTLRKLAEDQAGFRSRRASSNHTFAISVTAGAERTRELLEQRALQRAEVHSEEPQRHGE